MKFTAPELPHYIKICGVYKITFDDKWFYIGSTKDMYSRISRWKSQIKNKSRGLTLSMRKILHVNSVICFELIEQYEDDSCIRIRETFFIQSFLNNPMLLNTIPNGESDYSFKIPPAHLAAKVLQMNDLYEVLAEYNSLQEAAIILDIPIKSIQRHIKGRQRRKNPQLRGYRFMYAT